jgi:chromosome segregation ATPase
LLLGGPNELGASRRALSRERRTAAGGQTDESAAQAPSGQSARAALVDATRYDFERLERVVALLVEQQAELLDENGALREQVEDRERNVHRLESELDASNSRRRKAMERLDALIGELDRLDEGLQHSLQLRGGTPAASDAPGRSPS